MRSKVSPVMLVWILAGGCGGGGGGGGTTSSPPPPPPPPPPPVATADPQPIGSQNWPMFGHDYANTRASKDTTIGSQNLASLHVAQRVTGAGVSSTPAIVDGIAYFN